MSYEDLKSKVEAVMSVAHLQMNEHAHDELLLLCLI